MGSSLIEARTNFIVINASLGDVLAEIAKCPVRLQVRVALGNGIRECVSQAVHRPEVIPEQSLGGSPVIHVPRRLDVRIT